MDEMVDNDRPTNKARYARNSSWPGALGSTKGRIHLRRLVFSTLAFSLQSDGGPYIRPGGMLTSAVTGGGLATYASNWSQGHSSELIRDSRRIVSELTLIPKRKDPAG
jgi:hypothetical protein